MEISFSVNVPPYLRQWAISTMGGEPVRFKKGSALNSFLKIVVRHKRENESDMREDGNLRIIIPSYPGKDPRYFNFIPAKSRSAVIQMLRDLFDVELYREMSQFHNATSRKNDILAAWMEAKGIEVDDRNWNAVAKRLQILRARVTDRERKRKSYIPKKSETTPT